MNIPVSIIIAFCDRPITFRRTLIGWSNLDYPDYEFIFIDNTTKKVEEYKALLDEFGKTHKVKYLCFDPIRNLNIVWNAGYKEASGHFIIFAMQDEIISNKQILHHMLNEYDGKRISVLPFYLTQIMTNLMDAVDWQHNPELIETLPEFWTNKEVVNTTRSGASLLSNVTGQYRKDWDYFGLFRTNETGYLWIDQDVYLREVCLGKLATTAKGVKCYHQYHIKQEYNQTVGYTYKTEREARLLDPATLAT